MSLPGVIIPLQVYLHNVLYVSTRGHNPSTSTSPYCTLRLCPGSQSFYKCITIMYFTSLCGFTIPLQVHHHMYFTSLPRVTIPLQEHHHIVLYVSVRGHNPSTSTSPYCYFTSLPRLTILLHVHHHNVLCVSARGHNHSTSTLP